MLSYCHTGRVRLSSHHVLTLFSMHICKVCNIGLLQKKNVEAMEPQSLVKKTTTNSYVRCPGMASIKHMCWEAPVLSMSKDGQISLDLPYAVSCVKWQCCWFLCLSLLLLLSWQDEYTAELPSTGVRAFTVQYSWPLCGGAATPLFSYRQPSSDQCWESPDTHTFHSILKVM